MLMQRTSSAMAPWQLDTAPLLPVPVPPRPVVLRPQDVLRARVPLGRSAPSVGGSVLSMSPFSLESSTIVPTTFTRIRWMFLSSPRDGYRSTRSAFAAPRRSTATGAADPTTERAADKSPAAAEGGS
jgi:hypothetical protein